LCGKGRWYVLWVIALITIHPTTFFPACCVGAKTFLVFLSF